MHQAEQIEQSSAALRQRSHTRSHASAWASDAQSLAQHAHSATVEAEKAIAAVSVLEHGASAELNESSAFDDELATRSKILSSSARHLRKQCTGSDASNEQLRCAAEEVSLRREEVEARLNALHDEAAQLENELKQQTPSALLHGAEPKSNTAQHLASSENEEKNNPQSDGVERLIQMYPTADKQTADEVRHALEQFDSLARANRNETAPAPFSSSVPLEAREDREAFADACEHADASVGAQGTRAVIDRVAPRFPYLRRQDVSDAVARYFEHKRMRNKCKALAASTSKKRQEMYAECQRRLKESEANAERKIRGLSASARKLLRRTGSASSSTASSSSSQPMTSSTRLGHTRGTGSTVSQKQASSQAVGRSEEPDDERLEEEMARAHKLALHYIKQAEEQANKRILSAKEAEDKRWQHSKLAESVAEKEERRREADEHRRTEKAELEELRDKERQGFQAHLDRIRSKVDVQAERDPERAHASTQSRLQQLNATSHAGNATASDTPIGRSWHQHGFTVEQLQQDERYRLQQKLAAARLNGTATATEAMLTAKPVKPARPDAASSFTRLG